jgi:hypothetical protein
MAEAKLLVRMRPEPDQFIDVEKQIIKSPGAFARIVGMLEFSDRHVPNRSCLSQADLSGSHLVSETVSSQIDGRTGDRSGQSQRRDHFERSFD